MKLNRRQLRKLISETINGQNRIKEASENNKDSNLGFLEERLAYPTLWWKGKYASPKIKTAPSFKIKRSENDGEHEIVFTIKGLDYNKALMAGYGEDNFLREYFHRNNKFSIESYIKNHGFKPTSALKIRSAGVNTIDYEVYIKFK